MSPVSINMRLFLALFLLGTGGSDRWRANVNKHGIVFAGGLAAGLLRLVEFLHEAGLDGSAALLPPLPLGCGLGLDLLEAFAEGGV
jgi:hypothetical protein